MDSDDILPFTQAVLVATQYTRQHMATNQFLHSVGLQLAGAMRDGDKCTWKLRVINTHRWTIACIQYGF